MSQRIFLGLLLLLLPSASGLACSCGYPKPPLKELAQRDAVFSGTVIGVVDGEIHPAPDINASGKHVTVKVGKSWKGNVKGLVKIHTGMGLGDCGYQFTPQKEYIFYANRLDDGHLYTGICTRTGLLKNATNEIREIEGRLRVPKTPPADPQLELKGRMGDERLHRYVFTLRNRLHDRIFYLDYNAAGHLLQVSNGADWINYPPPEISAEPGPPPQDPEKSYLQWKQLYQTFDVESSSVYVDRLGSKPVLVLPPPRERTWRVGFQYLTEAEVNAGARIQDSKHFVWSKPITPATKTRSISFNEVFGPPEE